jgi:hypothetical protein
MTDITDDLASICLPKTDDPQPPAAAHEHNAVEAFADQPVADLARFAVVAPPIGSCVNVILTGFIVATIAPTTALPP